MIPDEQWNAFSSGADAIREQGVPLLLGGALALATHTGHWRNTKDVDVFVRRVDHEAAIAALQSVGFEDYHDTLPYDRAWIFRGIRDGVIFDVIWELPNHRVEIDSLWYERARPLTLRGAPFLSVGPEELVRIKLYVMQRDRCDWVDVLNVLASAVHLIDWRFLVDRMGRDLPLLQAALSVFNWMCPLRARALPEWLRARFALAPIIGDDLAEMEQRRTRLLDSRPWFALHQPLDQPLQL